MKRAAAVFAILSLPLSAFAAGPRYKIHWLLGHPTLDYFEEAAERFKSTVEAGSGGDIHVDIQLAQDGWEAAGTARPGPEIAARVAAGEAEMGHSFTDTVGALDHRFWAFDLPFLFRDYTHLEQVVEGPVGESMLEGLQAKGITGLAFTFSGGANTLSTRDKQVRAPADLKGLRVAVFGSDIDTAWLSALGALPRSIGHQEKSVIALEKDGAIDAAVLTWQRRYKIPPLEKDFRAASLEGASYLVSVTYVNSAFFKSLPAPYQKLVADAAREAGRIERAQTIALNHRARRRLMSKGVAAAELTDGERTAFEDALRPVYEKTLEPLVGKELISRIKKTGTVSGPVSRLP